MRILDKIEKMKFDDTDKLFLNLREDMVIKYLKYHRENVFRK